MGLGALRNSFKTLKSPLDKGAAEFEAFLDEIAEDVEESVDLLGSALADGFA